MGVALAKINEYAYRKEFGLSKKQYLEEPMEDVVVNQEIMEILGEIAKAKQRLAEKK